MKKIDEDYDDKDEYCINLIISDFFGYPCKMIENNLKIEGRSAGEKKHHPINTENRRLSVKLPYNEAYTHNTECLVNEVRSICNLKNYKIKIIESFPINGTIWRNGSILLIDWGEKNNRFSLYDSELKINENDKNTFLKQIAINMAFVYYLGIWDRHGGNFIWDIKTKKIFSIDHEQIDSHKVDGKSISNFKCILEKFYENEWYKNEKLQNCFENEFTKMWKIMEGKKEDIEKIFKKYDLEITLNYKHRTRMGPKIPCSLIMTKSNDSYKF